MVDIHEHLHCQLQAGGQLSSPSIPDNDAPRDIDDLLARFDNTLMRDVHEEPFIQDSGDDDGYYE